MPSVGGWIKESYVISTFVYFIDSREILLKPTEIVPGDLVSMKKRIRGQMKEIPAHDLPVHEMPLPSRGRQMTSQDRKIASRGRQMASQDRKMASQDRKMASRGRQMSSRGRQMASARGRQMPLASRGIWWVVSAIKNAIKRIMH